MTLATNVDMAALRAVYESGETSLRAITRDFCIGDRRLSSLARAGGWSRPDWLAKRVGRDTLDLDKLRDAYEGGQETVLKTAERFGISLSLLYDIISVQGWSRQRRGYRPDAMTKPVESRTAEDQQALIARLYDILGAQIRALAARDGTQPENDDKATRQLEQLIKCVRTIHDLRAALGGPEAGARDGGADERSPEEIRDEVFRRLDQRLAALRAEAPSGEPE